jgi:15-cis-phytoene synthase
MLRTGVSRLRSTRSDTGSPVQRDRELVRLHWPVELRPAFDALFAIDDAMAEVVASATQPALAAIKLAWWREALERLDDAPPPAEPRLRAAAEELLPRGVKGAHLARLEDGWLTLLEEAADQERVRRRGALLFGVAAQLLDKPAADVEQAGATWAEVDAARRFGKPLPQSAPKLRSGPGVRPITVLAALALRDVRRGDTSEPEATPGRAWTLLRHRITGR